LTCEYFLVFIFGVGRRIEGLYHIGKQSQHRE
jgi:hypothetical protein